MNSDGDNSSSKIEGNHWGVAEESDSESEVEVETTQQSETTQNGGIPPVVGMILMVAITVIMAAIVGTFVLDLGAEVANDSASTPSVVVEEHPDNNTVTVSITEIPDNYKSVTVEGPGKSSSIRTDRTFKFENPPQNAQITVTGTYVEASGPYSSSEETTTILLYSAEVTLDE